MLCLKWVGIVVERLGLRVWWDPRGHLKGVEVTRELPHLKESLKEMKINMIKSLKAHTNFHPCAAINSNSISSSTQISVNSHCMKSKATQRAFCTTLLTNKEKRHRVEAGTSNSMELFRASIRAIHCLRQQLERHLVGQKCSATWLRNSTWKWKTARCCPTLPNSSSSSKPSNVSRWEWTSWILTTPSSTTQCCKTFKLWSRTNGVKTRCRGDTMCRIRST